ncbi:MAG: hypothetical protein FJ029_07160 [Actinobacteria bacterium]|nr:hypothetical protein [Actinomycetota bacterium]
MASLTTKEYECLACRRRYRVPIQFLDDRGRDRGCPTCHSFARKRRRDALSWLRDALLSYSTV